MTAGPEMTALLVAVAAAAGALARYGFERRITAVVGPRLPWGLLTVNLSGSLALGVVLGAVTGRALGGTVATVLGVGFLGGYTTLSTYAVDVVTLGMQERTRASVAYAALSAVAGLGLAALGLGLGARL